MQPGKNRPISQRRLLKGIASFHEGIVKELAPKLDAATPLPPTAQLLLKPSTNTIPIFKKSEAENRLIKLSLPCKLLSVLSGLWPKT